MKFFSQGRSIFGVQVEDSGYFGQIVGNNMCLNGLMEMYDLN